MMIIHTNRKTEEGLREHGFDIPMFPETGNVMYQERKVGIMDNFNGLWIDDRDPIATKEIVSLGTELKLGLWNIPDYAKT